MNRGLRRVGICSCIFLVAGIFGISACGSGNSGNGGNSDEGNGILGRLAENLRKTAQTTSGLRARQSFLTLDSAVVEASATIDRICGMPIVRRLDTVPGSRLGDMYCVDVNADGTFTIPVGEKENDWVYVLIDSALPKKDQVVGFVGLQDIEATGQMLLSWPADAQNKNVDVGTVSADTSGQIISSATVADNQQAFTLTLDQLNTLAKNGQLMRAFRNDFINYDPETQRYYTIGPSYQWDVNLNEGVDQWSPLPTVDSYRGYSISIYHNDSTLNTKTLCDNGGSVALAIVPPASITVPTNNSTVTFGPDNPITNAYTTAVNDRDQCFDPSSGTNLYVGGGGEPPYVLGMLNGLKDSVSGDWVIQKNGAAIGWFDMETTAPFIDGDEANPIRVPVPRVRLTLDGNRTLVSLEVSWWMYDPDAAAYVQASDATAVQRLIGGAFHVGINDWDMKNEEKLMSNGDPDEPMQTTFTSFANPWSLPTAPGTGDYPVRDVRVMYSIARTSLTVDLTVAQ